MPPPPTILLKVQVTYLRDVNWSLLRAGIPPVWRLRIKNCDAAPAAGLRLQMLLGHYLDSGEIALPDIPPHQTRNVPLGRHRWKLNFSAAESLAGAADEFWRLAVGGDWAELPVCLLPTDEWCFGVRYRDGAWELDSALDVRRASF